jgi:hypothetical protein
VLEGVFMIKGDFMAFAIGETFYELVELLFEVNASSKTFSLELLALFLA